ncbi:V-type sodium ATP synthase subunit K [Clostridium tetani E88]|uniref:V-type sodium ATP synthase subunit K n=1 Tax=Clostridium tetani (strain Massachusetts / E88) TaxID=212717 RepID=Q896K8_CLOTE|nr:V-type sodium ATP synthase subunit K [Clostridium tetani E88]
MCSGLFARIDTADAAVLACAKADFHPTNAIGKHESKTLNPAPSSIPTLIFPIAMKAITNPYNPCVPGNSSRISALPNFSGSSVKSPDAASPTRPTPLADPIPGNIVAKATPKAANKTPPFCKKKLKKLLFIYYSSLILS